MYMGHLGIALAAKGKRPEVSLLVFCLAAVAPDLVAFSALGLGHANLGDLWSHTLAAMGGYTILFFLVYWLFTRRLIAALYIGAVAASHVLVDLITSHMPLWGGGPRIGLHLYLHPGRDFALEAAFILTGWFLYIQSLAPQRRLSPLSVGMLLLLLCLQGYMATLNIS